MSKKEIGVDSRRAAADGFPMENIIASDINNGNTFPGPL
ncbi:hypothetical protein AZE42_12380 [Rhizopogon vesiculosus]|uniref:Uncharacterized protein n=1 Tax=Rhizopogon vesiculosus TaxID=180088 RepID=A0A1J8PTS9_9AGAM|nr:hypothetical protein AZE42_12380 [Rhizopogon vesiculosus]